MKFKIAVSLVAREETLEAVIYYEDIRLGLGDDFLEDLGECYVAISENPYAYSYTDNKCILRDISLNRFPYVVIYKIQAEKIIIVSVHNTHKKITE